MLGDVQVRSPQELTPYRFRYITIPDLLPEDLAQLEKAIVLYGIIDPCIILSDGRIVDGQTRHRLALKVGLKQIAVRVATFPDPLAIEWYALECALVRRHLTPARKFQLAQALAAAEAERARIRKLAALSQFQGRIEALPDDRPRTKGKALMAIARKIGISLRTAEEIKTVMDKGPAGLFERLVHGEIKPKAAYRETTEALRAARAPNTLPPERERPAPHASRVRKHSHTVSVSPPSRPRMPASTPGALRELRARVGGWIKESGHWPANVQAAFWKSLGLLVSRVDELVDILNQYVRGDPALPGASE